MSLSSLIGAFVVFAARPKKEVAPPTDREAERQIDGLKQMLEEAKARVDAAERAAAYWRECAAHFEAHARRQRPLAMCPRCLAEHSASPPPPITPQHQQNLIAQQMAGLAQMAALVPPHLYGQQQNMAPTPFHVPGWDVDCTGGGRSRHFSRGLSWDGA